MLIPKQSVLHFWLTALRHAWANGAPIKLMFQGEARFGRISDVRRCWAPKPVRPLCQAMLTHDYTYAYAAVDVQSGELDTLALPHVNNDCMQRELAPEICPVR